MTGRQLGASFDQLVKKVILSDDLKENYAANYYFTAPNGKRIRSSTLLIKDADGRLTGALCINLDTTQITRQIDFCSRFCRRSRSRRQTVQEKARRGSMFP